MRIPSIILVENSLWVAKVLQAILHRQLQLSTEAVASSGTLLEQLQRRHYDLLLGDLNMPPWDALHLVRQAMALQPYLPIVLVSHNMTTSVAQVAIEQGAYYVMGKPFDVAELLETVQLALKTVRLRRQLQARSLVIGRLQRRLEPLTKVSSPPIDEIRNRVVRDTILTSQRLMATTRRTAAVSLDLVKTRLEGMARDLRETEARLMMAHVEARHRALRNVGKVNPPLIATNLNRTH